MKIRIVVIGLALQLASCVMAYYEPYFQKAEGYYGLGDYTRAIQYYLKAIAENDQRAETFFGLAMSYYRKGDLEDAQLAFEKTLEKDSSNAGAYERLASVNIDLGNPDTAIYLCKKALTLGEDQVQSMNTLGHAYFAKHQYARALDSYERSIDLAESQKRTSLGGRLAHAFDSDEAESQNGLGQVAQVRGLFQRSLDYFGMALALAPDWETPWFNKGKSYEALGANKAAEVAYRRATDLSPSFVDAHKALARLYRRDGRDFEAISEYRAALRVDPTDVDSYEGLISIYETRGDRSQLLATYDKMIENDPDDPNGYFEAAGANFESSRYDRSLELLQLAVNLKPDYAEAYNKMGEIFLLNKKVSDAQDAFLQAINADSTYAMPLFNLGKLLIGQGKEEEGFQYCRRAAGLGDLRAREFLRSHNVNLN